MAITDKNKSTIERLKELRSLYEAGILTEEEMEAEKAEILDMNKNDTQQPSIVEVNPKREDTDKGTTVLNDKTTKHPNALSKFFHSKTSIVVIGLLGVITIITLFVCIKSCGEQQSRSMDTHIADSIAFVSDVVDSCAFDSVTAHHISSDQEHEVFAYYYNARFGYRIAYPSHFTQMPESENSDGCEIRRDEQTYILVYGGYNALEETIEDIYNRSMTEQTTYSRLKNNWFIISGYTEDGRIFYQKTILRDEVIFTAILYYAKDENAYFSKIIPKIFSDFPD